MPLRLLLVMSLMSVGIITLARGAVAGTCVSQEVAAISSFGPSNINSQQGEIDVQDRTLDSACGGYGSSYVEATDFSGTYQYIGWKEYWCGSSHCFEVLWQGYLNGSRRCNPGPFSVTEPSSPAFRTTIVDSAPHWTFYWADALGDPWQALSYCLGSSAESPEAATDRFGTGTGMATVTTDLNYNNGGGSTWWSSPICYIDTTNSVWGIDSITIQGYNVDKGGTTC